METPQHNEYQELIEHSEFKRTTALPVRHQQIFDHYLLQQANMWFEHDIEQDMQQDEKHRNNVSEAERHFFDYIQAAFAVQDFIVNDNIGDKILTRIQDTDIEILYTFQMMMENIHAITYAKVLENAIKDQDQRQKLLQDATKIPTIAAKLTWVDKWTKVSQLEGLDDMVVEGIRQSLKWVDNFTEETETLEEELYLLDNRPLTDQLIVANAILEGVGFQGSFTGITWFARKGLFPGATKANDFIRRDEHNHVETAVMIHRDLIQYKISFDLVKQMITEFVDIESAFMEAAIIEPMRGMNATLMKYYIEYEADHLLTKLGYQKIYNRSLEDSFPWVVNDSLASESEFFQRKENYKIRGKDQTVEDSQHTTWVEDDSSEDFI